MENNLEFKGTKGITRISEQFQDSHYHTSRHVFSSDSPIAIAKTFGRDELECLSNAQLIAAAPQMLRAMKNAINELKLINGNKDIAIMELEKAINKALGINQ